MREGRTVSSVPSSVSSVSQLVPASEARGGRSVRTPEPTPSARHAYDTTKNSGSRSNVPRTDIAGRQAPTSRPARSPCTSGTSSAAVANPPSSRHHSAGRGAARRCRCSAPGTRGADGTRAASAPPRRCSRDSPRPRRRPPGRSGRTDNARPSPRRAPHGLVDSVRRQATPWY